MTNALVQLDATGTPSTLSYNVPDAISYPARHYIDFNFPEHFFHTAFTDTTYFEFDWVPDPVPDRSRSDGAPDLGVSPGYTNALLEVYQAMTSGFRCNVAARIFANPIADRTPNILKVRGGPYDKWFPDVGREATQLRYAITPSDVLYARVTPTPSLVYLGDSDGTTPYSGVYSVADNPAGSTVGLSPVLTSLTPVRVLEEARAGRRMMLHRDADDLLTCTFVPISSGITGYSLFVVEEYQLSSFYGNYGAGRTIKTLSLLPGEKTKMSFKSYRRSSASIKETSSVLDSYSRHSSEEFQNAVESETTRKSSDTRHDEGYVEASVSGSYMGVTAKVSGGFKGGASSAREQAAKSVSKALQKHAARASAKRDVKVEHTTDTTTESGEETGVERDIQNVNVGNTLSFVFRQMNQEHVSLWHLTSVKVAFSNGTYGSFRMVPLAQLDELLRDYISNPDGPIDPANPADRGPWGYGIGLPEGFVPTPAQPVPPGFITRLAYVRNAMLTECANVIDYRGDVISVVESVPVPNSPDVVALRAGFADEVTRLVASVTDNGVPDPSVALTAASPAPGRYVRFRRDFTDGGQDDPAVYEIAPNMTVTVPGIILDVNRNVLRTDGILVEALLGRGNGLDTYSAGLQLEAVRSKRYAVETIGAQAALEMAKQAVVSAKDRAAATLFTQMFPLPK